jgi:hypothetical protein
MKVLFLDHPEADFLAAALFMGLCEELGAENVVDFPFKLSYHGQVHRYMSPYRAADRGYDTNIPEGCPPQDVGTTGPFDWMPAQGGREWSRDEVIAALQRREFDLVILASPRKYNVTALADFIATLGRDKLPPIAMVDGEDYTHIRYDLTDQFRPAVYLKRELLATEPRTALRIEPFPLASPIPPREPVPKDIDILFLGGASWPGRQAVYDVLQKEFGNRFVGGGGRGYMDYLHAIARAKVAISVRGHGYDTLRYWEIPSMPGTLLLSDKLPIVRCYPFEHGVTALFFDGTHALLEAVRCALEDESWRQQMAQAGNAWLREHHTGRARARQLLQSVGVRS